MGQSVAPMTLQPDGLVYDVSAHFKPEFNIVGVGLSGGIDSAALLALAVKVYGASNVITFTVSLPAGRRAWEPVKAATIASVMGVRHVIINGDSDWYTQPQGTSGAKGTHTLFEIAAEMYPEMDARFVGSTTMWFAPMFIPTEAHRQYSIQHNLFHPLRKLQKQHTIDIIRQLNPSLLDLTHSCGVNYVSHCGKCYCCRERVRGFAALGITDTSVYDRSWDKMVAEVYPTSIYENRNWS